MRSCWPATARSASASGAGGKWMDKAAPSRSSNRSACLGALAALALAGCAAWARARPPDTTSINRSRAVSLDEFNAADRALGCDDIAAERWQIAQSMQEANGRIEGNRTRNEVAGYFGTLFLLPYMATENNDAEKDQITHLYARQDTLIKLTGAHGCPTPQSRPPSGTRVL